MKELPNNDRGARGNDQRRSGDKTAIEACPEGSETKPRSLGLSNAKIGLSFRVPLCAAKQPTGRAQPGSPAISQRRPARCGLSGKCGSINLLSW